MAGARTCSPPAKMNASPPGFGFLCSCCLDLTLLLSWGTDGQAIRAILLELVHRDTGHLLRGAPKKRPTGAFFGSPSLRYVHIGA